MTGARGDFVGSLGRRVEALRGSLRAIEQNPSDLGLRNGLLRRVHALSSAARVLGFASVAEALSEAERRLRKSEFADVARSLDLLPSLLLGVPAAHHPPAEVLAERLATTWPLSVLIFGAESLADAVRAIPGTHVECERTEELRAAREQARLLGPDLAIVDGDLEGARELLETFVNDPSVERVPLIVVGDFKGPEAASVYVALGAQRVLSKPVSTDALQRTVIELRALLAEPRAGREPLGELSVEALADRISAEVRRGLVDAAEPNARGTSVEFGDGADVMAAVWGAVARVRELVTLRSSGAVRFDSSGPEGAVPLAAWSPEERRAGDRGSAGTDTRAGDGVALKGRRIVVADDDPAVVWFMSALLTALGVEVLEAHDGARALALTFEAWPDLVVSDVLMPKLDGFTLCHEIKRDVAVRDVPVVLLSWKEDLLQRVRELGASADGYLRKEAAASTVAERLREVLRPRARVEQRLRAGGAARGRLDGLTPRLLLELASAGARDVRVGIRDAVYLYEVQVRSGRLCAATRTAADGSSERGERVLAALLGVSAGRFVVEPDSTQCQVDFEGSVAQILKAPIERARSALNSISAGALVGVTRVHIVAPTIEGYLACTPEPARALLEKIMHGASPRELITSGSVAPRLLEAVLSDVARRGAISDIERTGSEPSALRDSRSTELESPPTALTAASPKGAAASPSAPSPSASFARPLAPTLSSTLPLNTEITPSIDKLWGKLTEGVFSDSGTLDSVGLPDVGPASRSDRPWLRGSLPPVSASLPPVAASVPPLASTLPVPASGPLVAASVPSPAQVPSVPPALPAAPPLESNRPPARAEVSDALSNALTEESPSPPRVSADAPAQTQVMAAVALSVEAKALDVAPSVDTARSADVARSLESTLVSEPKRVPSEASVVEPPAARAAVSSAPVLVSKAPIARQARSRRQASKAPLPSEAPRANANSGWFLRVLLVGALAFGAAYVAVSYYRAQSATGAASQPPAPASS